MELLYIWVQEYKNINNQEFNFHPEHRFHYNQTTNTLSCQENPNAIGNFFNKKVSNVTAIVGENGAGKTTLLEILSRVPILKEKKSLFENDISIFYEKGEYFVYTSDNVTIKDYKNFNKNINFPDFNYKTIYHSSLYTRQTHNIESGQNVIDISTEKYTSSQVKTDEDYGIKFRVNDIFKQANFIKNNDSFFTEEMNIIKKPKFLRLSFEWLGTAHAKINKKLDKQGKKKEDKTILDTFRDKKNMLYYAYVLKRCFEEYNKSDAKKLIISKIENYSCC